MSPRKTTPPLVSGDIVIPDRHMKLIEEYEAIEIQSARDAGALGFMARILVQATIPHKDPGAATGWARTNGPFSLILQSGHCVGPTGAVKPIGLPFGSTPRLLLAWMTTEAVRTKNRHLLLGDSLAGFMRVLGLVQPGSSPTGGRWGSSTRMKDQMKRLFTSSMSCVYDAEKKGEWAEQGFRVTDGSTLFWDPTSPSQATLWNSTVTLSEMFFQSVVERPVPVDMRALKALKRSPMELDIYCWLTYRMSYLRQPTRIPWELLQRQFGADYRRTRSFKENFLRHLRTVLLVYPHANIEGGDEGVMLRRGRPHVSKR